MQTIHMKCQALFSLKKTKQKKLINTAQYWSNIPILQAAACSPEVVRTLSWLGEAKGGARAILSPWLFRCGRG